MLYKEYLKSFVGKSCEVIYYESKSIITLLFSEKEGRYNLIEVGDDFIIIRYVYKDLTVMETFPLNCISLKILN